MAAEATADLRRKGEYIVNFVKWLYPGMRIKRWLGLLMFGLVLLSLGLAYMAVQVYRTQPFPEWVGFITLQFIDRPVRGAIFLSLGIGAMAIALLKLNDSVLSAILPEGRDSLVDIVYNRRHRQRGPKLVVIGGGTGLSTLLRGIKEYTTNITAIVTVADDGGSSGRLRRELGVLPPGDFRNCIVALADAEPLMTKLFQYRFSEGPAWTATASAICSSSPCPGSPATSSRPSGSPAGSWPCAGRFSPQPWRT